MPGISDLDPARLPVHVGIIMDGNGRWARKRNLIRSQGHYEGLKATKKVVKAAADFGIRYLTLYVFSTENWKRSIEEVGYLWDLMKRFLYAEMDFYKANGVRIRHVGDQAGMPEDVRGELKKVEAETAGFDGMTVVLALNYGGRDEIVRAVERCRAEGMEKIDEKAIAAHLDNPDIPDPDLVIRPSGEFRTSNFLLWESAYSEYYFSDVLWPDWSSDQLLTALLAYQSRDRRFGGVKQQ